MTETINTGPSDTPGTYRYMPVVILNANSAGGRSGGLSENIRTILKEMQSEAEVIETRSADEGRRAIEGVIAQEQGPVVICGGDGSVVRAASTLLDAGSKVPLGIVPLGTGNDYAWGTLGLPRELRGALAVALHGRPRAPCSARGTSSSR